MNESSEGHRKPRFGIGSVVLHPSFGKGRIVGYENHTYVIVFKGGESKKVSFAYEQIEPVELMGDPFLDSVRQAVRETLGDYGWLDVELELGKRWAGGTLTLTPGKEQTQPREMPIENFFKKLTGVREKLRVLEQKINHHPSLSEEERAELQGYITRCYGSLTSFNTLFASKNSQFKGTGRKENEHDRD